MGVGVGLYLEKSGAEHCWDWKTWTTVCLKGARRPEGHDFAVADRIFRQQFHRSVDPLLNWFARKYRDQWAVSTDGAVWRYPCRQAHIATKVAIVWSEDPVRISPAAGTQILSGGMSAQQGREGHETRCSLAAVCKGCNPHAMLSTASAVSKWWS